jgi:hypothetical protein
VHCQGAFQHLEVKMASDDVCLPVSGNITSTLLSNVRPITELS